jgi:IclR family pca regulon transcriptional regulator
MKNNDNPLFRSGDPNFMTSLARGLHVIHAFADQGRRLTIADLSRATGLTRAVVRRCVYTLSELGYIGSERNHYFLRAKVLNLGSAYLSTTPLTVAVQPILDEVSRELEEPSAAGVLDESTVVCVAQAAARRHITGSGMVGSRYPAYCTASGRVLLAHAGEERIHDYLEAIERKAFTRFTVTGIEELQAILADVRERGYAQCQQELTLGMRSIAVPVHNGAGHVVAAIVAATEAAHADVGDLTERFLPVLRQGATRLESEMGTQAQNPAR